jgi:adenylate cyclase
MKNKLWLLQIPIILIFTFFFHITQLGEEGGLQNELLREEIYPKLRNFQGKLANFKFYLRKPEPPRNKIIIAAIDDYSIQSIGRWPWTRNYMGELTERLAELNVKAIGFDVVFAESDQRVHPQLANLLTQNGLGEYIDFFETDPVLEEAIRKHSDKVVLGWSPGITCQPAYSPQGSCDLYSPDMLAGIPSGFEKFSIHRGRAPASFQNGPRTPLITVQEFLENIPSYNEAARQAGFFSTQPDPDGYVRRSSLVHLSGGHVYPALALEMSRVGLQEELFVDFDAKNRIREIRYLQSGKSIPVTGLGGMEINFRGPSMTFPRVSIIDLIADDSEILIGMSSKGVGSRNPACEGCVSVEEEFGPNAYIANKAEFFKDAYVLIGPTALGIYDMRAFPFDSNTAGVEGHANILDNLLALDPLIPSGAGRNKMAIFLLMTLGACVFAFATQKLQAIPALILFVTVIGGFGIIDIQLLFKNNYNWNTVFFYIQITSIFMFTLAARYIIEERNKKFIKVAFSKYVAPSIVESIIKDPAKLTVGGEKKDLTILFSDIRSFTSMSEKMDAKELSNFLNDYLGDMTRLVFKNDGTLDKYMGDAVMAFWGAPLDQPNHAYNCAQAAIAMMKNLDERSDYFKEKYDIDVKIGIGLNSGEVSVGNMGSEEIFEYTVIGDHVNLASRLEGLTKPYGVGIITTRFTLDSIEKSGNPLPPHRPLDIVKVKGKNNGVEIFELIHTDIPPEGIEMFAKGRELYLERKWDESIAQFKKSSEILKTSTGKDDLPCRMYIERCETFKETPPPSDWDGSWVMTSK